MRKKLAIIALVFALSIALIVTFVVSRREFIQNKILDAVIQKYSPSLPFQIESYQLTKDLKSLRLNLVWSGYRISIDGALDLNWISTADGWKIRYAPAITVDQAQPLHFVLQLEAPSDFSFVKNIQVQSDEARPDAAFVWKAMGIDVQKPRMTFGYQSSDETIRLDVRSASGMWMDPKRDQHAVSVSEPTVTFQKQGDQIDLRIQAKSSEVLWESFYSDLPLVDLPLHLSTRDQNQFELVLGSKNELKMVLKRPANAADPISISWKSSAISFAPLARWALKTIPASIWSPEGWSDLEWKEGTIQTQGSALFDWQKKTIRLQFGEVGGRNLSFRSISHSILARQVSFSFPYRENETVHQGWVEALQIYFKQFPARLKKTDFQWSDRFFKTRGSVPLDVGGTLVRLGAIDVQFHPNEEDTYEAKTSLQISAPNLQFIDRGLCLKPGQIPPAQLKVDFSSIHLSPGVIDPSGKINVGLFEGNIEVHDLGFFDLGTEVPEVDFDVEWSGIDLEKLTAWSNFGKMKGTLEGYAHEVVFQSFLPTQYRFLSQLQPLERGKPKAHIDVSPEAMKNIVMLFTGENLDEQIPGIAGWVMFGWLPHLLGGYDLYYAGVSLNSQDGQIVLETLDLESIFKETQKRFFLYGPRFKMPLKTSAYPLVIDATAMSNFVHQMISRFSNLKGGSESHDQNQNPCHPPEL